VGIPLSWAELNCGAGKAVDRFHQTLSCFSGKLSALRGPLSAVGNNLLVIAWENLRAYEILSIGVYIESDGGPLELIGFVAVHTS
jgi:hypothetical protein